MHEEDINLRHLRVLTLLLERGSLTRTAEILETSQSSVSKILAKLRKHFGDPLFVRVGPIMRPTPRALELTGPLKTLLTVSDAMRWSTSAFGPQSSIREFSVMVTEVGMIRIVPALISHLETAGRGLRLKAIPLDARQFEARLEAGEADVAVGAFPRASPTMKRQRLYFDNYVSVVRKDHPRLSRLSEKEGFLHERHIVVTSSQTGHAAHQLLERALTSEVGPDRVKVKVPSFVAAAFVASCTEAVGSMPAKLAEYLAADLNLAILKTPIELPRIEISQFWHARVDKDQGHRWFRSAIAALFGPSSRDTKAPRIAVPSRK
jgi:DNA-binding transcriptional LysR family regulator